jgi:exosortase
LRIANFRAVRQYKFLCPSWIFFPQRHDLVIRGDYTVAMNILPAQAKLSRVLALPWAAVLLLGIWTWAIWSCAEHWRGNPNYSYGWAVPILATGFVFRRYLLIEWGDSIQAPSVLHMSILPRIGIALFAGAIFFALEYSREQMWHPEIVLWLICLFAVASTVAVLRLCGGDALARGELFPVLFFLTAVPWPPRFEQPIVSSLMRWIAATTTELLHWFGIEAQISGAAIALRSGFVGISEACSGVRSLQSGIMFGLAMGEWFLLWPVRRVILLLIAVALALVTNLIRTLALSLQAEWHGVESLDRVHDLIGNIMITALILLIWVAGKVLAPRRSSAFGLSIQQIAQHLRIFVRTLTIPAGRTFRALVLSLLIGIIGARSLSAWIEAKEQTQTAPLFSAKVEKSNQLRRIPPEIWNELRPTTGEQIRHQSAELPGGAADCFHFFWKPSPWNRFALVHRPDICMPGVGWKSSGPAEPLIVSLDGESIRCHLFRFHRGDVYALELWGVWRNGQPLSLNYKPAQVMGTAVPPSSLHFEGKRGSATEIIACSVIANGTAPPAEVAVALLRSVFEYKRHE